MSCFDRPFVNQPQPIGHTPIGDVSRGARALDAMGQGIRLPIEEEMEATRLLSAGMVRLKSDAFGRDQSSALSKYLAADRLPETKSLADIALERIKNPLDSIWLTD